VCASLKDSNKERKTSQLPRQLCWTMERREREEACRLLGKGGELLMCGTNPTGGRSRGRALFLREERTAKAEGRAGAQRPCRGEFPRGYEVHLTGTPPARESRGRLLPINCHIHGVLTLGLWGGRSGEDCWSRSCRTLFEGGSVVVTPVTTMGGEVGQQDGTGLWFPP